MAAGSRNSWPLVAATSYSPPLGSSDLIAANWVQPFSHQTAYQTPVIGFSTSNYTCQHSPQALSDPSHPDQIHVSHGDIWPSQHHWSRAQQPTHNVAPSVSHMHFHTSGSLSPEATPLLHPASDSMQSSYSSSTQDSMLDDTIEYIGISSNRQVRRKIQNRNAQRTYRARREAQIRDTECQLTILKRQLEESQRANKVLETREAELKRQVRALQDVLESIEMTESQDVGADMTMSSPSRVEVERAYRDNVSSGRTTTHGPQRSMRRPNHMSHA